MASFSEAYRKAGYRLSNPRNQWSARKADGSGVAITIWADEIDKSSDPWVFDCRDHPLYHEWGGRVGNSIRTRDIEFAIEHLNGQFDLILCRAVDPTESPRKIKTADHWTARVGQIDPREFDAETGQFRMMLVPRTSVSSRG
ncbi:MAG: hypothetical protein RIE60_03395 [Roseovarius sp.]|uniref:hypothetical protein n=1 Tax=Roseovarius sp. TaxID=1486281 RepID=UPI0032ED5890